MNVIDLQHIKKVQSKGPYTIVGYSFGAAVAYEMSVQLEANGEKVNLFLLDGSPAYISTHTSAYKIKKNVDVNDIKTRIGAYLRFIAALKEVDLTKVRD